MTESTEQPRVPEGEAFEGAESTSNNPVEGVLEIGKIREASDLLRARITAAAKAREEDLQKRVGDREGFIGEAKRLSENIDEATQILGYFETLEQIGELDTEGRAELESIRTIVRGLQENLAEADRRAIALESHGDVMGVVQGQAIEDAKERDMAKVFETELERYRAEGVEIANELLGLSAELERTVAEVGEQERAYHILDLAVKDGCDRILTKADFDLRDEAKSILYHEVENTDKLLERFRDYRKQQGVFAMKNKAVIDALCREEPRLRELAEAHRLVRVAKQKAEGVRTKIDELAANYQKADNRARKADDMPDNMRTREKASKNKYGGVQFFSDQLYDGVYATVFDNAIQAAHEEPHRSSHSMLSLMDKPENRALSNAWYRLEARTRK